MDKIIVYSRDAIALMLTQATAGKDTGAWLASMRQKIADMVKERPAAYRTFGPFWWPVKAQLVAAGLMAGEVMPAQVEAVTTGDDAMDMCGAVAFHGYNVDQLRDDATFSVDTESGDQVDYVLADEELDALIAAG